MAAEHRPRRLAAVTGSIRWRVTATAVAVVAVALVAGAVAMLATLRRGNENHVRAAARLRAAEIAAVIEAGGAPGALAVDDDDEVLLQIVDRSGTGVAASPNISGRPPGTEVAAGESRRIATTPIEDEPSIVAAEAARGPAGTVIVLVARTVVDESTGTVASLLRAGIPLLLLLVGVTTWRAAGRALAPVEAMRAEVDAISAAELSRRLPDPPGRDEITRLAATMNRMLERLEAAQARQRRFVADASHELRSPLAIIRQHAEVALAHPDRADAARLARTVLDEDIRMQQLVEDLLALARADEGSLRFVRRPVDLDDLVLEIAAELRDGTGLAVDTTGVSAGRVAGDESQLRRAVRNLADNAARHARTRIAFTLAEDDAGPGGSGTTRLCVDDDGDGVPETERQRIFERFVRLDDARSRDTGGAGLGLAIVAEVVGAHGGRVTAGVSPLGGARFEAVLPSSP
jgi:signal transduction histidine kinase